MTFKVNVIESSTCTLMIQFKTVIKIASWLKLWQFYWGLLVESKNTYTKVCSNDLSSFIFMATETHSSFLLSFGQLSSSYYPFNVVFNYCSCNLITQFSASPPNLHKNIPRIFRLRVSAFGFHELLLHLLMNPVSFYLHLFELCHNLSREWH